MPRDLLAEKQGPRDLLTPPAPKVDEPWYVDAAQAADDMARLAAQGFTFGYADKLAGYLSGEGTEAERAKTQEARKRAGLAGTVGEVGSAVALPLGLASKGITLAGRGGTAAMTGGRGLAARTGLMATEGAGYGALAASGNDQDIKTGALIGAVGGGAGNLVGEGASKLVGKAASLFNRGTRAPTRAQLQEAADTAYQQADEASGIFPSRNVDELIGRVETRMAGEGFLPENQPGVAAGIRALNRYRGQNVTFKGMEQLRRAVSKGFRLDNKDNNRMLHSFVRELDQFVDTNTPNHYQKARQLYQRLAKVRAVEGALERAKGRAGRTGSGGNLDNAIRQETAKVAKRQYGLTADELAALKEIEKGTPARNLARAVGAMGPSGNGLGKMMWGATALGGGVANPLSLIPLGAAAGGTMLAKKGGQAATRKAAEQVIDLMAAGGSRAAITPAPNVVQRLAETKREALARALMAAGVYGTIAGPQ